MSNINVNLLSAFNDKGVKDAISSLNRLSSGFKSFGKQLVGGYVGFQGLEKGINFVRGASDAARDLQRNMAGLQTIFGPATKEMTAFAEAGVQMGMSTAEAAKATTFIGSVMKQSGFVMKDNTVLTKELVKLGSDLAATYGYDVQEALTGMTALFRGEYDPIEKFGVAIKQAQVNTEMARLGMGKLTGQEKLHAQQLVRMKLLFQATGDAQGAFTRQTNTLFVAQQQLSSTWTNLQAKLGSTLIGPMTSLVKLLQSLTSTLGPSLESLFSAIGNMMGIFGGNASAAAVSISKIIEQLTILIRIATPIFGVLINLLSNMGAGIVMGVLAFKGMGAAVRGVGVVVDAYKARLLALQLQEIATAAATGLLTEAEAKAVSGMIAAEAALAATPWGAIATAIGLVAAELIVLIPAMAEAGAQTKKLKGDVEGITGRVWAYNLSQEGAAKAYQRMSAGATTYTGDVLKQAAAIALARAENEEFIKGAKTAAAANKGKPRGAATSPLSTVDSMLRDFQKAMGKVNSVANSAGSKAAKTAKDKAKEAATAAKKAFADQAEAIKSELAKLHDAIVGAFDITSMGKSGGSISRNIDKFMVKLRQFAGYISQLRASGLNENLLSQLAMAGPDAGLAAAKAFASSPGLVSQANAAYGELGTTAKAIAGNVVQAQAQNVYNVTVTGGVGSGATIGKAVVAAIQQYELQSGPSWRK